MSLSPVSSAAISKHMRVLEIITLCPESERIIAEYGLHCFNCSLNAEETLLDGCLTHGFQEEEIDELVDDINQLIAALPGKPETLVITEAAANGIREIAVADNRLGEGLVVIADGQGGFCLEFREAPEGDEKIFGNAEVPDVRVFASLLTLKRIGGATIDMRDGRFKLDLAEDTAVSGCACGGNCGCGKESA